MRRLLTLCLFVPAAACTKKEPPPPPPPMVDRCEVDLSSLNLFSEVGNGAKAVVIGSADQLVGGPAASGTLGDTLLENDRVRVVIQKPGRSISPTPYGGTIIDADLKRGVGEPGRDRFGKLEVLYQFGRTINVTDVEILSDGSKGGPAVVAATGRDAVLDYINVQNVIAEYLGAGVKLAVDPDAPLPLKATTYYVLSPGESRVRVLTAFCNTSNDVLTTAVGDLVEQGGESDFFNPGGCTNGLGSSSCLVDPSGLYGYQADGVAYGIRQHKVADLKTPEPANALLYVYGVVGTLVGGEGQSGLLTWVDETATRRPGAFGVPAGGQRLYLRDFVVGRDFGDITSQLAAFDGTQRARLTVTATLADGSPAADTRVAVLAAATNQQRTLLVTDAQGQAKVDLPAGDYRLLTGRLGHALEPLVPVQVPTSGTAEATVKVGASRTLAVTVKDPFGTPVPAKVIVICPGGPCTPKPTDYRPLHAVDDTPSTMAAIAFVGASGEARIPVPPGQYQVLVSRGMEWSGWPETYPATGQAIDLTTTDQSVSATLAKVVSTPGWVSADLHVHAVASPDSSVANTVRAANFAAEGVDVLVSTDHDFIVDYAPVISALGLQNQMASMIGAEVTPFEFGHHNAYPLVRRELPGGGAFDWAGGDGPTLRFDQIYAGLRADHPDVVIQMNHPRGSSGALSALKVDTATGASHADPLVFRQTPAAGASALDSKLFSNDFDAIEVSNGITPSYAVLNDWMTFLSRGLVKTATGVSDSHDVNGDLGGYSRTWVKTGSDDLAAFSPKAFSDAMKGHRAIVSSGPFITLTARRLASGAPVGEVAEVGGLVKLGAGETLELTVDVQAPEWMTFDAIELYTHATGRETTNGVSNGAWPEARIFQRKTFDPRALTVEPVPGLGGFVARRIHVTETFTVTPTQDTWFVAMVRGGSATPALAPFAWHGVDCKDGVCSAKQQRAVGFTNAILVDGDQSGAYDTFPLKQGLTVAAPKAELPAARLTPTEAEFAEALRRALRHGAD